MTTQQPREDRGANSDPKFLGKDMSSGNSGETSFRKGS